MTKTDNVWLTEPERFNKMFKSVVYDQFGSLVIHSNEIIFTSNKGKKILKAPFTIKLVYTRFPLFNFILAIGIVIAYGILRHKSPEFTGIMLTTILILFSLLRLQQKWILVEYKNKSKTDRIYLSDGSMRGWKGVFGGTRRLYKILQKNIAEN